MILYISSLTVSLKFKPFENKFMNFLTITNELAYITVLTFFLVLAVMGDSLTAKQRYDRFGYPMMGLVAITMAINMIVCIIQVICVLKESLSKKKVAKEETAGSDIKKSSNGKMNLNES